MFFDSKHPKIRAPGLEILDTQGMNPAHRKWIILGIILAAVGIAAGLFQLKPEQQKKDDEKLDLLVDVLTLEGSVSARDHIGGTAPAQVAAAAERALARLAER